MSRERVNQASRSSEIWLVIAVIFVAIAVIAVVIMTSCALGFIPCQQSTFLENPGSARQPNNSAAQPMVTSLAQPTLEIRPTSVISKMDFSTLEQALHTLRTSKKITVAYSIESGPYSYLENQAPTGFEVEMVRELVERWFQATTDAEIESHINWVPIQATDRVDKAKQTDIDFVIGALSSTPDRCNGQTLICTTTFHAHDTPAMLVRKDSSISGFCDHKLDTQPVQYIAVIAKTTNDPSVSQQRLPADLEDCHFTNPPRIQTRDTRLQAVDSVINGATIGYVTDRIVLEFYREQSSAANALVVIGQSNRPEDYVFLLKTGNEGLRDLIDLTIQAMASDKTETLQNLYKQYIGCNPQRISKDNLLEDKYNRILSQSENKNLLTNTLRPANFQSNNCPGNDTSGSLDKSTSK
ncbi:MAG: transporter substrate-binding domain-containing protein [Caldilineaceae bacterium]